MLDSRESDALIRQLTEVFGGFRAEWMNTHDIFETFSRPSFFPALETVSACVLEGGRGTGKTTLLTALSYEGQREFRIRAGVVDEPLPYIGVYFKVDTGSVRAFQGPELSELEWSRVFQHYWNLECCRQVLGVVARYELDYGQRIHFPPARLELISESFGLPSVVSWQELRDKVALLFVLLERYASNVASKAAAPVLSALGTPIRIAVEAFRDALGDDAPPLFLLVDEYEALLPYQQRIVNTLIKRSDTSLSYKIGVRELGLRERGTLNPDEVLTDPADYVLFQIGSELDDRFAGYAMDICSRRLARIDGNVVPRIDAILPGLTADQEAQLLGLTEERATSASPGLMRLSVLERSLLRAWCEHNGEDVEAAAAGISRNPAKWRDRLNNYQFAYLFSLRRGLPGIRKYYAGWQVFCALAAANTRYLLELVYEALIEHIKRGGAYGAAIAVDVQTRAAQEVAKKNLRELEGVSVFGGQLARLVLGLGRIFGKLAEYPFGIAPETNQFELEKSAESGGEAAGELLAAAVQHLALLRIPGTKLQSPSSVRDWDFTVHPLYSALFNFSYRRKRKMTIQSSDLLLMAKDPARAVERVLSTRAPQIFAAGATPASDDLPEQLSFLSGTYETDK